MITFRGDTATVNGRTYHPSLSSFERLWNLYFGVQVALGNRQFAFPTEDYKGPFVIDWKGFTEWRMSQ